MILDGELIFSKRLGRHAEPGEVVGLVEGQSQVIPTPSSSTMDGTLLDSRAAVVDAVAAGLRRAYGHHGLPVVDADRKLLADCMGLPSRAYFEQAFAPATVPEATRSAFADSYERFTAEEEVAAIARGETRLYDGVEETLAELKARGHRLLLFSNAGRIYFDAVVAGHDLGRFSSGRSASARPR